MLRTVLWQCGGGVAVWWQCGVAGVAVWQCGVAVWQCGVVYDNNDCLERKVVRCANAMQRKQ